MSPREGRDPTRILVSIPGGGVFFFWQAGAVDALLQHVHGLRKKRKLDAQLSDDSKENSCSDPEPLTASIGNDPNVEFVFAGASAGALCAVLAASEVDFSTAISTLADIMTSRGISGKGPWALVGIWGEVLRQWLDEVLPVDAAAKCSGSVVIHLVRLRWLRRPHLLRVTTFETRDDVISACMCSAHLPFMMNGRPWTNFGGHTVVDGSLLAATGFHSKQNITSADGVEPDVVIDHTKDALCGKSIHFIENIQPETALMLFRQGNQFAKTGKSVAVK